jgi:hypothetical protein
MFAPKLRKSRVHSSRILDRRATLDGLDLLSHKADQRPDDGKGTATGTGDSTQLLYMYGRGMSVQLTVLSADYSLVSRPPILRS